MSLARSLAGALLAAHSLCVLSFAAQPIRMENPGNRLQAELASIEFWSDTLKAALNWPW
jgi:hypothetical protein